MELANLLPNSWRNYTVFPLLQVAGGSFGLVLLCEVTFTLVFTEFNIGIYVWRFLLLYRYLINFLER